VILGLGNTGKKYLKTRHNVGFMVVERVASHHSLRFKEGKGDYYFASGNLSDNRFVLLLPTTYMNNSGLAARHFVETNKISPNDILVVCDDIHLELGAIRIRAKGSDGGHNGLKSIIYELAVNNFPRLRIGIGKKHGEASQSEYVLSNFTEEEFNIINLSIDLASKICDEFITAGLKAAKDFFSKENQKLKDTSNIEAIN
jgi:PTH1 family peptidyl-tRNA hydrolase